MSIENATLYSRQEQQSRAIEAANVTLTKEITERKRAEGELSRYKDHLEDLVKERTRELEKAQGRLVELVASRRHGRGRVGRAAQRRQRHEQRQRRRQHGARSRERVARRRAHARRRAARRQRRSPCRVSSRRGSRGPQAAGLLPQARPGARGRETRDPRQHRPARRAPRAHEEDHRGAAVVREGQRA